jgi:hypothetical protein
MRFLASLVLIGQFAGSAAFAQVNLSSQQNVKDGDEFRSQAEIKVEQKLTIAGMPIETKSEQFLIQVEKITATPDGKVGSTRKTETLQLNLEIPGESKFSFDSGNAAPPATTNELLKSIGSFLGLLSKAELLTAYDADGKVDRVKWSDNSLDAVPASFKKEVDPETLKKAANQDLDRLPNKTVNKGDSWTRTEEKTMGGGQKMTFEMKYTYEGPATVNGKNLEKIGVKTTGVTLVVEPNESQPAEFKNSKLAVKESTGFLGYDPQTRRIVHSENTVHVTGDITIVVQNMELPTEIDLTITAKEAQQ